MEDRPPPAAAAGPTLESGPDPNHVSGTPGDARVPSLAEPIEVIPVQPPVLPLHDLRARLVGIPLFGLTIPQATGLFGGLRPSSAMYWVGVLYFILLSFVIWQGNRFLLILQRERFDWLDRPVRKACVLITASVGYTAPVTVAMLVLWYRVSGLPGVNWPVIRTVLIIVLTVVIFVTHVYETVYLIRQRTRDALRVEQTERARIEAELEALRNQVDPHFIFNSLNALAHLIEGGSTRALVFAERLADVYRYVLLNRSRDLVALGDELEFLDNYYQLVELRYGDALLLEVTADAARLETCHIVPISLQVLLENAVKHNETSPASPLVVTVTLGDDVVSVANTRRPRARPQHSSRLGLQNLDARCRLVVGRGVEIEETDEGFTVRLPVATGSGSRRVSSASTSRQDRTATP